MSSIFRSATYQIALAASIVLSSASVQAQKPLTNADVVAMVTSGLPESTIVGSMQPNPTNFDVTPAALIELNKAGISARVMDAMLAAAAKNASRAPSTPTGTPTGTTTGTTTRTTTSGTTAASAPSVTLVQGDRRQNLSIERTAMTQTAAKGKSLGALSKDRALDQAVRAGVSEAASRAGSSAVGTAVGQTAGGIVGGLFSGSGKPKDVTYVWSLNGVTATTTLPIDMPTFEVAPGRIIGVRPEEYTPAIVKLTAVSSARLVGATEGKESARSRSAMDWPIYSSFIEDRVPVQTQKLPNGNWQVSTATPLQPGEYAIVLRPTSKDKRFSGADVARNQGDGVLFNAAWSFAVR